MDKLDYSALFVRIVEEQGSFGYRRRGSGVSRPVATAAIKALEVSLGARLLHRTTPGTYGRQRELAVLSALVIIPGGLEGGQPQRRGASPRHSGRRGGERHGADPASAAAAVSRPLPGHYARSGKASADVDLVREGVDCVIRGGHLPDCLNDLPALAGLQEITCASPTYLARYGFYLD